MLEMLFVHRTLKLFASGAREKCMFLRSEASEKCALADVCQSIRGSDREGWTDMAQHYFFTAKEKPCGCRD